MEDGKLWKNNPFLPNQTIMKAAADVVWPCLVANIEIKIALIHRNTGSCCFGSWVSAQWLQAHWHDLAYSQMLPTRCQSEQRSAALNTSDTFPPHYSSSPSSHLHPISLFQLRKMINVHLATGGFSNCQHTRRSQRNVHTCTCACAHAHRHMCVKMH